MNLSWIRLTAEGNRRGASLLNLFFELHNAAPNLFNTGAELSAVLDKQRMIKALRFFAGVYAAAARVDYRAAVLLCSKALS